MRKLFITIELIVLVGLLVGLGLAYTYRYAISDWYYLRSYTPSAQVAALATQATMTTKGRKLFYRANPQIVLKRADMIRYCNISDSQVAELGCYLSTDHIYLLQISDPALQNQMASTAGYEMLHSVYQRMSGGQRRTLDTELERLAAQITDPNILSQLQIYAKSEPGERDDELYSVLGTEYQNLPADLERNYAQYFSNRTRLVNYYQQFSQAFDLLQAQITELNSQITAQKAVMNQDLATKQIARYNSLVPIINQQITTYNNDVNLYNQYGREILGEQSNASAQ